MRLWRRPTCGCLCTNGACSRRSKGSEITRGCVDKRKTTKGMMKRRMVNLEAMGTPAAGRTRAQPARVQNLAIGNSSLHHLKSASRMPLRSRTSSYRQFQISELFLCLHLTHVGACNLTESNAGLEAHRHDVNFHRHHLPQQSCRARALMMQMGSLQSQRMRFLHLPVMLLPPHLLCPCHRRLMSMPLHRCLHQPWSPIAHLRR